ncbi:UDP-N-acetylmuramoylalanyl-D-glutamate--2,6-diaminopimelate ligase [Formivibrio citricus]|uniref:UDP-N-acetylmuramoyl-L-alanyl-D-glutamate--2,6-diaminopimelate ligase n=1 Tax=Formivibrio citricus TaxID=83765 RepID=A0A1I4VNT6_9NEIS|nr:UDP-N-acetylmuramoyl-L-alanyl-D-glutamate--2,6-diaminopimelate ligase [Formivibrio citricus]SFN02747.1 UDP-N-acetylmuramoylalanyl-D-glutamate--2,6-diaminopimelate ligase [Formivibrio citricus]
MKPASWLLPAPDWVAIDSLAAGRRIVSDSRQIQAGDVFLAFRGEYADGRKYIPEAIAAGAAGVIWEAEGFCWDDAWPVSNVGVPQLRELAGIVVAHLLGNPSAVLWVAGVTGTNGKTSIANWLAQAFTQAGGKGGVLGTVGNGFPGELEASTHTTLDPVGVQNWMRRLLDQGATHVAMELSSHGLDQARAHGVAVDCAVFTNLTRDHLDYHGDMDEYGAAKARLFEWEGLKSAVINQDDTFGRKLLGLTRAETVYTYGLEDGDIRPLKLDVSLDGIHMRVATPLGETQIASPLIGRFNASNLLACLGVLLAAGIALETAAKALGKIEPAPGRMQRLGGGAQPLIVVDYAHTPDALEKALSTLRESMSGPGRLICVFGCGGNRDRGKRALMGEIACRLADSVIITSDNPRDEVPQAIIDDIVAGVSGVPGTGKDHYAIESDRAHAIVDAVELARPGDVVLIAGKGHENYQEIRGERHAFDDVEQAGLALAGKLSRSLMGR